MNEPNKESTRLHKIGFLIKTLIPLTGAVVGVLLKEGIGRYVTLLQSVHWTIWVATVLMIYLIVSFAVEHYQPDSELLRKIFRIPLWTELRTFGEQSAARLSYWALVGIPLITYILKSSLLSSIFPNFQVPLNLKLSYFASWFIAFSLITFSVSCPAKFRKKKPFEKVRTVNLLLNDVREPNIVIEGEEDEDDPILDKSTPQLRTICFGFYVFGIVTVLVILVRSGFFVLTA